MLQKYFSELVLLGKNVFPENRGAGSNAQTSVVFSRCRSAQTGFYKRLSHSTESMPEAVEPGDRAGGWRTLRQNVSRA